jgi:type IV pilus assembly protein PilE
MMSNWAKRNPQRGFTLIELMITVVIIAILASVAYPSYNRYVVKTRRTEGRNLLAEIRAEQERYYSQRNTYTTDLSALGLTVTGGGVLSENGHYSVSAAACSGSTIASCVMLTAAPQGVQATNDTQCGSLTLNSREQKGRTGTAAVADCW